MKTDLVHALTQTFEGHAQQTDGGVEFWLARDLQQLLGYTEWRNFTAVIVQGEDCLRSVSDTRSPTILLTSTKWSILALAASGKSMTSCSPATPAT